MDGCVHTIVVTARHFEGLAELLDVFVGGVVASRACGGEFAWW